MNTELRKKEKKNELEKKKFQGDEKCSFWKNYKESEKNYYHTTDFFQKIYWP